ncbi:MAG: hypothetical protein JKY65_08545 [Planctomycetes bacterium]|nr:hypothetical protein [Planctomycetota bacterium]
MTSRNAGSGPRSNRYSASKFSNWSTFDPFWGEVQATLKRFDSKISRRPEHAKVIFLPPARHFAHPCSEADIHAKLDTVPSEFLSGLRAIFMLSGSKKQLRSLDSALACSGTYWNNCIFLHPSLTSSLDSIKDSTRTFYLDDVLIHEIGHHVDRARESDLKTKEGFADWFAIEHGSRTATA